MSSHRHRRAALRAQVPSQHGQPDPGLPSKWADLPSHLLDSVTDHLTVAEDYARFTTVCESWNKIGMENYSKAPRLSDAPVLLVHQGGKCIDPWRVYNVLEERVLDTRCFVPDYRYCGSAFGWLIAVNPDFTVMLVNPFMRQGKTLAKENSLIRLPKLDQESYWIPRQDEETCCYYFSTATITADPVLNPSNCTIVAVHEGGDGLSFMSLTDKDNGKGWTHLRARDVKIQEIMPVKDKLFAVSEDTLLSLDLAARSLTPVSTRLDDVDYKRKVYLVELKDKSIVMVHRVLVDEGGRSVTKTFRMFQLNADNNWDLKKSLADEAIFVGGNSSSSVIASEVGCKKNAIYFVRDDGDAYDRKKPWKHDLGVFDVYMNKILKFKMSNTGLIKKARQPPIWVLPTLQL